jgi:hypothetical protein
METVWTGTLDKMRVEAPQAPDELVRYALADAWPEARERTADYPLNGLIGQRLRLRFTGQINCVACARPIARTFSQGYCFPCAQSLAETDICMVRPELCHYHDRDHPCRDETFARSQCFQPHVLYCALTSGVKVGITRQRNIPGRWIDQGAVAAIPLALLPSRGEVGLLEKRLTDEGFTDKTHWTRMLKGDPPADFDLAGTAQQVVARLRAWGVAGVLPPPERGLRQFRYPVRRWPDRVVSLDPGRQPVIDGLLEGVKGQYLLLDCGVLNVRKFGGYRAVLHR